MKYMKAFLLFPLYFSASSYAQTIEEIFPYTVQSHSSSGEISMKSHAEIKGEGKTSGMVEFQRIIENHKHARCYGSKCYVNNDFSPTQSVSGFNANGKTSLNIIKNKDHVLADGIYFVDGDVDLNQGSLKKASQDSKVAIFINGSFYLNGNNSGNGGQVGEPDSPVLIFSKGADIKGRYYGYLYSMDDATIQTPHGDFCGRVSSSNLNMVAHAEIDSSGDCSYDFGWFDKDEDQEDVTLVANDKVGYVNGENANAAKITIESLSEKTEQAFKVSYGAGELSYKKADSSGPYVQVQDGGEITLPLNTPLSIKYNYPSAVTLTLEPKIEGLAAQSVSLAFVPYVVEITLHDQCPDVSASFIYADHSGCPVLAKAGEAKSVPLTFVAYGIDGSNNQKGQELTDYSFVFPNANTVSVNGTFLSNIEDGIAFDKVETIEASVLEHCAAYAPDCGEKTTKASSAIIGRTVPASLKVTATAGDIAGDVVYAGKPGVTFETAPSFSVVGLDTKGNELSSYSGEFAGGLAGNTSLELNTSADHELLEWKITDQGNGEHVITLEDDKLNFIKDSPFPETKLNLPLELIINDHDGTQGVANAKSTLAQEDDKLRFGFVTLMDTEVKVGEMGTMHSKLHYYGDDLQTLEEDTGYDLADATGVTHEPVPEPELELAIVDRDVTVQPYEKQKKNIEVTIENLPDWLKPEQASALVDPVGMLDILNNPRLRASDRTFNRREVIR